MDALVATPQFAAKEVRVSALVRDLEGAKAQALKTKGVALVEGSFDNKESLMAAMAKADRCFLVCNNVLNQVDLECNVIEAAEASDACKYLVKISTCGAVVEGAPPYISKDSVIQYGRYHAAIDERLDACTKLMWTSLRPNYFMQNFIGDVFGTLANKMVAYPHQKDQKATLIDVRDIGDIAAKMLLLSDEKIGSTYHGKKLDIGGLKSYSIPDIVDIYSKALKNVPIKLVRCSEEEFAKGLVGGAGFPEWLATSVAKSHTVFWEGNATDYQSPPEIKELHPKFRTFEEWVAEHAHLVKLVE